MSTLEVVLRSILVLLGFVKPDGQGFPEDTSKHRYY